MESMEMLSSSIWMWISWAAFRSPASISSRFCFIRGSIFGRFHASNPSLISWARRATFQEPNAPHSFTKRQNHSMILLGCELDKSAFQLPRSLAIIVSDCSQSPLPSSRTRRSSRFSWSRRVLAVVKGNMRVEMRLPTFSSSRSVIRSWVRGLSGEAAEPPRRSTERLGVTKPFMILGRTDCRLL